MGADVIAAILAKLVVALLQWGAERHDFRAAVLREVESDSARKALAALGWQAQAAADPGGGAQLRVRPGGGHVPLPGEPPGPPG